MLEVEFDYAQKITVIQAKIEDKFKEVINKYYQKTSINPDNVCFDMFNGLDNIGEVTLHVPRSCKKRYEDYGVEWMNGRITKSYLRFHHIEEFDL